MRVWIGLFLVLAGSALTLGAFGTDMHVGMMVTVQLLGIWLIALAALVALPPAERSRRWTATILATGLGLVVVLLATVLLLGANADMRERLSFAVEEEHRMRDCERAHREHPPEVLEQCIYAVLVDIESRRLNPNRGGTQ